MHTKEIDEVSQPNKNEIKTNQKSEINMNYFENQFLFLINFKYEFFYYYYLTISVINECSVNEHTNFYLLI